MGAGTFFRLCLLAALCLSSSSFVFGQKPTGLPGGLAENATIEEIFRILDEGILPEARIGLESNAPGAQTDEVPTTATRYYELAFFSKGFKLARIDGCNITLRNDDVKLIGFTTGYPNPAEGSLDDFRKVQGDQPRFAGELFIPLQSFKANKAPFRHTKKAEKMALLGTWRTEFKQRSGFSLLPILILRLPTKDDIRAAMKNALRVEIVNARQNGENDKMYGDELTFTFDDKQMSADFYAAFSRVIALCKDK